MRIAVLAAAAVLLPAASFADDYYRYTEAVDAFDQAIYLGAVSQAQAQLKETPNHAPSRLLMARAYLKLKKCPEAGAAAAGASGLMAQASIAPAPSAQAQLETLFSDLDAQCGASLDLGRAYVQAKDYKKAAGYYRGYLQKSPEDMVAQLELANILSWDKQYAASAERYRRYLDARPGETAAVLGLADVLAWSGDHRGAEAQLRKVLGREPDNGGARARLGRVYEWQGKYAAAKSEYEKAASLSPNDDGGAREALDRLKDSAATRRAVTPSSEIAAEIEKTGNFSLFLKLADAQYHNEGRVEESLASYRRYLKKYPQDRKAKLKLARVLGWEKKYDESAELYRECLAKEPADDAARLELANVLSWQGNHAAALAELEIVKRNDPSSSAAYLAAGDINRWGRDFPEARDNYRKALFLLPNDTRALDALREIDAQWSAGPVLRFGGEGVSVDDIDFKRLSLDLGADFRLDDGRIGVSPGLKTHYFRQHGQVLEARELYVNGSVPIQNGWRWQGGASVLDVLARRTKLYGSLGIEGTFSTHTWLKMGYVGQEAVFETSNLTALLSTASIRLDSFNIEFARSFLVDNEFRGVVSAGFLTDHNSRARVFLKALHRISDAPTVKVGAAFKALTFAQTSPYYWSPSSYSGPGLTAELERRWKAFSYKAGLSIFRITQTQSTESSVEGGVAWRPRGGFFGELSFTAGRGAGASIGGTTNTAYKSALLAAGYKF